MYDHHSAKILLCGLTGYWGMLTLRFCIHQNGNLVTIFCDLAVLGKKLLTMLCKGKMNLIEIEGICLSDCLQ